MQLRKHQCSHPSSQQHVKVDIRSGCQLKEVWGRDKRGHRAPERPWLHRRERAFAQENPQAQLSKATVGAEGVKVQKSQQTTPVGVRDCRAWPGSLQSACPRGARRSKLRKNPTTGEQGSAQHRENSTVTHPQTNCPWNLQYHCAEQNWSPWSLSTKFIGLQRPGR